MIDSYDVIVVALGSMGSAAAHSLAARGLRVLGLETFWPAHDQGSAHGGTRIIRKAYFEGPAYVPLLQGAFDGWRALQQQSGRDLIRLCGGIYIGDPDSVIVTGSLEAARVHGLPHELLDSAEIRARFPTCTPQTTPSGCTRRTPATYGPRRPCWPMWTSPVGMALYCTSKSR
jgi:sarcosine oxidase